MSLRNRLSLIVVCIIRRSEHKTVISLLNKYPFSHNCLRNWDIRAQGKYLTVKCIYYLSYLCVYVQLREHSTKRSSHCELYLLTVAKVPKLRYRSWLQRRNADTTIKRYDHYATPGTAATFPIMESVQEWRRLLASLQDMHILNATKSHPAHKEQAVINISGFHRDASQS
jgi:hypothetical protein